MSSNLTSSQNTVSWAECQNPYGAQAAYGPLSSTLPWRSAHNSTEEADRRPSAGVDDGFVTTESELAVYAGEAAERESKRLSQQSKGSRQAYW